MARGKKVEQSVDNVSAECVAEMEQETESHVQADGVDVASGAEDSTAQDVSLEEQLAAATQEAEMYKDRFLRARADLENYRKRSVQYIAEGVRDAQKQVVEAILPVVDNLERAVEYQERHQTDSVEDLLTGVRMTLWQLREVLERHEVKRIAALGETFDPRYHEAVEVEPVDDAEEVDTVVGEIQTGYLLGDAVIRPARVRVAQRRHRDDEPADSA